MTMAAGEGGALLRLRARFSIPGQRLRIELNNVALATVMPKVPGQVERWQVPIRPGVLRFGVNQLRFVNSVANAPGSPIVVEKVTLGNAWRSYPWMQGILAVDDGSQGQRGTPWQRTVTTLLALAIAVTISTITLTIGKEASRTWWWGSLGPPMILVLALAGLNAWGSVTPYRFLLSDAALFQGWGLAWGIGAGLRLLGAMILMCESRLRRKAVRPPASRSVSWPQRSLSALRRPGSALRRWTNWRVSRQRCQRMIVAAGRIGLRVLLRAGVIGRWTIVGLTRCLPMRPLILLGIVVMALGLRGLVYLNHPWIPLEGIGTGADSDAYLFNAIGIASLKPFLLQLVRPSLDFPLLAWHPPVPENVPITFALALGSFIKLWGMYPGILYWVWTMAVLSSLVCLVPYVWQRFWGYPGVGGIIVGILLAMSPTILEEVPKAMTDHVGLLLLGATYLLIGRLASLERWGTVVFASLGLAFMALSRSAGSYLSGFMIMALGIGWWWSSTTTAQRTARLLKVLCLIMLTLLWLAGVEWSTLAGIDQHPLVLRVTLRHMNWATHEGPMAMTLLAGAQKNLTVMLSALRGEHPGWWWALPAALGFSFGCLSRWRSRQTLPCVLVLVPWLGYIAILLPGSAVPRYLLPWLLMEGLLIAQCLDVGWLYLRRRVTPCSPASQNVWGVLRAATVLLTIGLVLVVGQQAWGQWCRYQASRVASESYFAWVKPRLPANAVILLGTRGDPWRTARALDRPVAYPISPYCVCPLVVMPHLLGRHPVLLGSHEYLAVPFPSIPTAPWRADALSARSFPGPAGRLFEACLRAGQTLWVLDTPADLDATARYLEEDCKTGWVAGRLELVVAESNHGQPSWKLHQLRRASSRSGGVRGKPPYES